MSPRPRFRYIARGGGAGWRGRCRVTARLRQKSEGSVDTCQVEGRVIGPVVHCSCVMWGVRVDLCLLIYALAESSSIV